MLYSRADKFYHDSFVSSYEYGITFHAYPQNARIENRPVYSRTYSPTGAGEIHSQKNILRSKLRAGRSSEKTKK